MRLFLTGASGFIGSAVVPELLAAGHRVLALARSEASAVSLQAAGCEVLRGSLTDLDVLRVGAREADGVLHLGFVHDFANWQESFRIDAAAVSVLGETLVGTDKPLSIASGLLGVTRGRAATEEDAATASPRGQVGEAVIALASRGVRSSILRLPPTVHGAGDHGFVPHLVRQAREKGVAAYVGDGESRWPAVHVRDAARLVRTVLEHAPAGTRVHLAAEEGVRTRDIAQVIARRVGVPVASKTAEEIGAYVGFLAPFWGLDATASATVTRQRFDWTPREPGLLADLDSDAYFPGGS